MSLEEALKERLRIIDCTPQELTNFLEAYPASSRLTKVYKFCVGAPQVTDCCVVRSGVMA